MLKIREQIITTRVLSDLKKRSTIGIIFYPIALTIVIFSDNYYLRQPAFAYQFLILIFSISFFRIGHMLLNEKLPQHWINTTIFMTSVILTALIWGIGYALFTLQQEELYTQLLMVTCTIGLCSGGVVAFIPNLWLAFGFNASIMLPAIVSFTVLTHNYPLGVLFILFFIYMIFMAHRQNREYWTALDNEYLLEQKTKELKRLSNRDPLTGLYNRRYFDRTFSHEWKQAIRNTTFVNVIMCDVDHFKTVNDRYGHAAGDEYLKMLAKILQRVFRRDTDIVSRYGGEEFIILIVNEPIETARALAEKVRRFVEDSSLEFENHSIRTTVSLGLANTVPEPGMEREKLIAVADKCLYMAKERGRNQLCFTDPKGSDAQCDIST